MNQFKSETGSGQNIVYLNYTHSGMMLGMLESSAAPLSQPGNTYQVYSQYPIDSALLPMPPRPRLTPVEEAEFDASLERSLHAHADVWAALAKL